MSHSDCVYCDLNNFDIGQKVKPLPNTDAFECGEVTGTVESTARNIVTVVMDSGRHRRFARCALERL